MVSSVLLIVLICSCILISSFWIAHSADFLFVGSGSGLFGVSSDSIGVKVSSMVMVSFSRFSNSDRISSMLEWMVLGFEIGSPAPVLRFSWVFIFYPFALWALLGWGCF